MTKRRDEAKPSTLESERDAAFLIYTGLHEAAEAYGWASKDALAHFRDLAGIVERANDCMQRAERERAKYAALAKSARDRLQQAGALYLDLETRARDAGLPEHPEASEALHLMARSRETRAIGEIAIRLRKGC